MYKVTGLPYGVDEGPEACNSETRPRTILVAEIDRIRPWLRCLSLAHLELTLGAGATPFYITWSRI